jgi:hypothetical protein
VRVYLAATLPLLARWCAAGEADAPVASAVTPQLREWYREADLEEMEYSASVAAALGSLRLLAADRSAPRRRVVLVAELADPAVAPLADPDRALTGAERRAAVALRSPVPDSCWQSLLVDGVEAAEVVVAAVAALPAADEDDDAAFALDEAIATDLGWYAVQELPELLG